MKIILFILSTTLIIFCSCKKDKDVIALHTINGMVFNNCTDSGLENVTVYLNINDGKSTSSRQTISDSNGNFSFDGVSIHSSSKYSYAIYIPSKSGINGGGGTEVGFNGTTLNFNYDEVDMFFKPRVTPKFLFLCYQSNATFPIMQPDSLDIYFEQKTFHKNVPLLPYSGVIYNNSNISSCSSNYPMGKWNFIIKKWKSGVYTTTIDSIYLGWGSTTTYTINW